VSESDFTVANTRRAYWRMHPVQRLVSEEAFVARGYDRELLDKLAARLGQGPMQKLVLPKRLQAMQPREPGEDTFDDVNETTGEIA
jgi:hypothetical protein